MHLKHSIMPDNLQEITHAPKQMHPFVSGIIYGTSNVNKYELYSFYFLPCFQNFSHLV